MPIDCLKPNTTLTSGGMSLVPDQTVTFLSDHIKRWNGSSEADVGILGVPFDGCVSYRPGARFGPEGVRRAMKLCTTFSVSLDVDCATLNIVDCGDVVTSNDLIKMQSNIEMVITHMLNHGMTPLLIGGDHSISFPAIRALSQHNKGVKIGVIDFDAHFDNRSPQPGHEHSGMWASQIQDMEDLPVSPQNIVQIGIGDFAYSRNYSDAIKAAGGSYFTPYDVREQGMKSICVEALERACDGVDALYVTVDIDCLQQAYAPGTSVPNATGLTPWELLEGLSIVCTHPLVRGLDLVEIAPPLDLNDMTSRLGAEIIGNMLCGLAQR